jgi:PST family polysaccharide transporter
LKTKSLAILLGPSGIGLFSVYSAVVDLARSAAQLGINASGVRQIAESVGSSDVLRIARTVTVLRRVALMLGLLGMAAVAALSSQVSQWAFSTEQHAASIAWLSIAVFFRLVADGQAAMLQGMRRIAVLAKLGVLGSLAGAIVSIAFAAALGEHGVVPGLVATAVVSALISWRYAREVPVERVVMQSTDMRDEALALLKLGLAFMASALLMTGAAFFVRAIVLREGGVAATGLYHAAWTMGGVYIGVVLQAMGTDFYPRLVAAIRNRESSNRMLNEQIQVSLVLAGPGIVATIVLAPLLLSAFYSNSFAVAASTLQWITLGMALRVITRPLGYVIVAHNRRLLFFGAELIWTTVNVGLSWLMVQSHGIEGAGIAFFLSYVVHALVVFPLAVHLNGFRWSRESIALGLCFTGAICATCAGLLVLQGVAMIAFATAMCVLVGTGSVLALMHLVPEDEMPSALRRMRRQLQSGRKMGRPLSHTTDKASTP